MLRNIPDPGHGDDDGQADPALTAALAAWRDDPSVEDEVLAALAGARLLVPVIAVLTESEPRRAATVATGGREPRGDKSSDMAVPTLTVPDGRRALPAFTSTQTLAAWQSDARPVAVPLEQALRAAAQEGADTLVIDLAGPVPYELAGGALRTLARGDDRAAVPPAHDPVVTEALRAVLAADDGVAGAHLEPPRNADSDGTLALALAQHVDPRAVAERVAGQLAVDETLRATLVHGLELAVLPSGSALPEGAFHRR